jgi:predicted NBD/HSP70 family sugar kinase
MILGVDLGATTTCAAALESTGNPVKPRVLEAHSFDTSRLFDPTMNVLEHTARRFQARYGTIDQVGVAAAGRLNPARSELLIAGNLPQWCGKPMADRIASFTPDATRRVLGNDALAQALYEAYNNPDLRGVNFLLVSVGTGIGVAWVIWVGGKPIGIPTEGSHIELSALDYPNPEKCGCGQFNCMERLGSGDGAQQRFRKAAADIDLAEWEVVARDQARGIANLLQTNVLGTTVVYGGGVTEKQPHLRALVQKFLDEHAERTGGVQPTLVRATCSKLDAAMTGYALLLDEAA